MDKYVTNLLCSVCVLNSLSVLKPSLLHFNKLLPTNQQKLSLAVKSSQKDFCSLSERSWIRSHWRLMLSSLSQSVKGYDLLKLCPQICKNDSAAGRRCSMVWNSWPCICQTTYWPLLCELVTVGPWVQCPELANVSTSVTLPAIKLHPIPRHHKPLDTGGGDEGFIIVGRIDRLIHAFS